MPDIYTLICEYLGGTYIAQLSAKSRSGRRFVLAEHSQRTRIHSRRSTIGGESGPRWWFALGCRWLYQCLVFHRFNKARTNPDQSRADTL